MATTTTATSGFSDLVQELVLDENYYFKVVNG